MKGFKYAQGSATKKGALPTKRLCTKDHTVYPLYFDSNGRKRTKAEVEKLIEQHKSKELK